jgi:hypothetical protein
VTGLATTTTGVGTQVTSGGLPLYRYAGDRAAGDANGDGIVNFGGVWHVVKVSGGSSGSSSTSSVAGGSGTASNPSSTSSSSSNSSGYGY